MITLFGGYISQSTKLNYIIVCTERAPTGQQAHSPGQSAAAPRESNIDTPRPARAKA